MMMMNIIIHKETEEYINTWKRVSFIVIVIAIDFVIKEQCFFLFTSKKMSGNIALLNIDLKFVIFYSFVIFMYLYYGAVWCS